jgi:hypothetical protein
MGFPELCRFVTREYREAEGGWGTVLVDEAFALVAQAEASGETRRIVDALQLLAENLLIHGRNDEAVLHLERAMGLAVGIDAPRQRLDGLRMALGVAELRRGETSHCIESHNADSCLFPIAGGGVWADPGAAESALGCFLEVLDGSPRDRPARWLANLAAMAAGTWPDAVPEELRLPEELVTAEGELPRFPDVAPALGLATDDCAGGAILDDFDNDGFLDVVTSSVYPCEPLHYFRSRGDGTFELRVEEAGLAEQLGGLNCLQADYDGDGWLDVLVLRGAWMGRYFGRQRRSLLRNDGRGGFVDVTQAAGLKGAFPTQAAAWADYDLDGDLDLYVGNEAFPRELYRNRGDGTFEEVAAAAGVDGGRAFTKGVAWGDYDDDGDPDLFVSNWEEDFFYRNEGDGTFREIGEQLGVARHGLSGDFSAGARVVPGGGTGENASFAAWFFDYDNDGGLDLYVGGYNATLDSVVADYLGLPVNDPRRLRLFHNDRRGGFENRAAALGVGRVLLPMGANYGDVDNDGWLDFYLGTGQPRYEYLVPNVLYHNQEGRSFADVSVATGMGHLQKGHGVAFGDIDNDGDQDIFAQMGGFYPADAFRDALFLNPGTPHRWVTLVLRGSKANTRAVGARIEVRVVTPSGERSLHLVAGSGGSFGASSLQQEVGLGDALGIARVTVRWPAGAAQVFEDLPLDCTVELSEGETGFRVLERPRLSLGQ